MSLGKSVNTDPALSFHIEKFTRIEALPVRHIIIIPLYITFASDSHLSRLLVPSETEVMPTSRL